MVILATACVEGVMRFSAQSAVNSSMAAVVAVNRRIFSKGKSRILSQRRSEEGMKIVRPEEGFNVPTNIQSYGLASSDHEYGVIIHLTSESDDLFGESKRARESTWDP